MAAWGSRSSDLTSKINLIRENKLGSLIAMPFRQINASEIKELADALEDNHSLTELHISKLSIDDLALLANSLKNNCSITTLNLGDSSLGDSGALIILEMMLINTSIATLDLENKGLSSKSCLPLGSLIASSKSLTSLNINRNKISNDGLENLSLSIESDKILAIKSLCLSDCNITLPPEESKNRDLLLSCVQTLDFSNNNLNDTSTSLFNLNSMASLTSLNLSYTNIGPLTCGLLGKIISTKECKLKFLNLSSNKLGSSASFFVSGLLYNTSLIELNLNNNLIKDETANQIGKSLIDNGKSILTMLSLKENLISNVGMISLFQSNGISKLELFGNKMVKEAEDEEGEKNISLILKLIGSSSTIEFLDLGFNNISNEHIVTLMGELKSNFCLKQLDICGNIEVEEKTKEVIQALLKANDKIKISFENKAK